MEEQRGRSLGFGSSVFGLIVIGATIGIGLAVGNFHPEDGKYGQVWYYSIPLIYGCWKVFTPVRRAMFDRDR